MKKISFNKNFSSLNWNYILIPLLLFLLPIGTWGQKSGEKAVEELVKEGFENVRWTENDSTQIYTLENNLYRLQGLGIRRAIEIIQNNGLSNDKSCQLIITHLNIPQISLIYQPSSKDSIGEMRLRDWKTSYELKDSWEEIKREEKKNSSQFKVDILIYPQLAFMNLIITQIYQVLFQLSPAIEISLWSGMKLTGQIKLPVYNDGYGRLEDQVHPGHLTISQRFRLPYNIFGKITAGYFNTDRYGLDLSLFHPLKDERFSLEGRIGYVGIGYWDGFTLHYDKDMSFNWSFGGNFYWPQYNTQFKLSAHQFLLGEKGIKFEMIRHFRYASIGFYAMKAEHANSNGGFKFQVALPPYRKYKRGKYIPRINVSPNMGIIYNAGNERKYYKEYKAEASDNIMEKNSFNPYYIKSELLNF